MKIFKGNHTPSLWAKSIQYLMNLQYEVPAAHDRAVMTKDDNVHFEIGEAGVQDMLDGELHPQTSQTEGLDIYINQYINGSKECEKSKGSQPYTYHSRTYSQIQKIKELGLMEQEFNRRITVKTWDKFEDLGAKNPPCLQSIWIRRLNNDEAEAHTYWRSHDGFGAWQWNNIAITQYINRELIEPYGLTLTKFVEMNSSLHVYDYDWVAARKIGVFPPALTRRV